MTSAQSAWQQTQEPAQQQAIEIGFHSAPDLQAIDTDSIGVTPIGLPALSHQQTGLVEGLHPHPVRPWEQPQRQRMRSAFSSVISSAELGCTRSDLFFVHLQPGLLRRFVERVWIIKLFYGRGGWAKCKESFLCIAHHPHSEMCDWDL